MYGTLKKTVDFNEMSLSQGASVYIDLAQAQMYDQMDPGESLSVSVALKYFTVRANIQKSNIQLAD